MQIANALLKDLKAEFDHVFHTNLMQRVVDLNIDNNLIGWT